MAKFIINIALHSAVEKDYKILQQEMEKESFNSTKKYPGKGGSYLLWIAEFSREGALSLKEITDAAFRAAKKTGKEYSFTVIRDKTTTNHLHVSKSSAVHKI